METRQNKGLARSIKTSTTVRMLIIGLIILVLMIPLIFIKDLIRERSERQQEVVNEVSTLWGDDVLVMGPILKVPYFTYTQSTKMVKGSNKVVTERKSKLNHAYFFPEELHIDAKIDAIKKERGIYETSVFTSNMDFSGSFKRPDFNSIDVKQEDVLWKKATVIIKTSNVKGIKTKIMMKLDDHTTSFLPKYEQGGTTTSASAQTVKTYTLESLPLGQENLFSKDVLAFDTTININGSEKIRFIPIGEQTEVQMGSNWKDPSFSGAFLPEEDNHKEVGAEGFKAHWTVLQTNRQFGQAFYNNLPNLKEFAFGTDFLVPVDEYQKSERSVKYGYLVIALTFLVFFLIQTVSGIQIHPFQYVMIGLVLVMFYTLLLSISEHQNFLRAYLISGAAVICLISLYARSILNRIKFLLLVFSSLTALYTFIFVVIQLENYALLVGSIGLFVILGTVMLTTRKIDWSKTEQFVS